MTMVRESRVVLYRPKGVYSDSIGARLYGFWLFLCMLGDEVTREHFAKTVFYRNRKQLEDASVSWWGADVFVIANAVLLHDFSPVRADPQLCRLSVRSREEFQVSRETLWLVT